ncbi:MAG: hydroxymethylglutaryl-CoA synthase, partial [Pseudomonadota bacterium]
VDGKYSVECYLKSLAETYRRHRRNGGESYMNLAYLLFHLPFPKMSWKALNVIADEEARISGRVVAGEELAGIYDEKVLPGTIGAKEIGNIYCGSLYLSLASLLEIKGDCAAGERIGMFSYGSGSCAEFFTGMIGAGSEIWEGKVGLLSGISRRKDIGFADYLKFRDHTARLSRNNSYKVEKMPLVDSIPPDTHQLFLGYRDFRRVYIQGPATRVAASPRARSEINSQFKS